MENLTKDVKNDEDLDDIEDEEEEEEFEEDDEAEEEEDEEDDVDGGGEVTVGRRSGRGLTLKTLLKERILETGDGSMTINYLGNKFKGDLLSDGRIRSQETNKIFGTPSAWAIFCKKIVNPDKKSGCGWASVRYRGKKLDTYKNNWFRQKRLEYEKEEEIEEEESSCESEACHVEQEIVEFDQLGNRSDTHDSSTMVELNTFQSLGRLQPFNITMSSSAMAVIDLHAHLTSSEVVGYLAGQWDVNNHNLIVSHAFPLTSRLADAKRGKIVEKEVLREMNNLKLSLVGWYHTHPSAPPLPSLKDIDTQLDYEMKMKGYNDASYTPVLGIIVSPYSKNTTPVKGLPHANGNATGYWVIPPPENKPHEFGRPMSMQFTIVQDAFIPKEALMHMSETVKYYKDCPDAVSWCDEFEESVPYWHKLLISLRSRVPKDHFWPLVEFLKKIIDMKLPSEELLINQPTPVSLPPVSDEKPTSDSDIMMSPDLKSFNISDTLERQSSEDSLDRGSYAKQSDSSKIVDSMFTKPKSPRPFSPFFHHTPPPPLFASSVKDKEIPSLLPLNLQMDDQRPPSGDSLDKKESQYAAMSRDDKSSFSLDRPSSSYISSVRYLEMSLKKANDEEKQSESKEPEIQPPAFALSDWVAQQKYPKEFFSLSTHDRDIPFIRDASLLHKAPAVVDLPSQWKTGLNLGKTPKQSATPESSKTPLKLNPFNFSAESPSEKLEKSPEERSEKQSKADDEAMEYL